MLTNAVLCKLFAVVALGGIATLSIACGSQAVASGPRSSGPEATSVAIDARQSLEQRIELAEQVVRNGKYELPDIGAFQLKDGNYLEKYGEGATQVKRVGVVAVAFGDIDGDRGEDAAVVLWANTGGSGTFLYLAPMLNKDGTSQQAGAQLLGDRVQIKSLTVDSGAIRVEALTHGSGDPMVSPSLQSVQNYGLQNGALIKLSPAISDAPPATKPAEQPVPQSPQPTATPAPAPTDKPSSGPAQPATEGLAGSIWIWQRFADSSGQGSFLLPYPAAYRLELLPDGRFLFQADCNSGSGGYTVEGSRLSLKTGPMTLAECQPRSRYTQYVAMLGQVASYVLKDDSLYLNLKMDGGDMVFGKLNSVTGSIVGPVGDTLPPGATAEIMIVNNAGTQIGGSIVNAELPMRFEAPFKPANIDSFTAYMLQVTIKDAQKDVVFRSSRPYRVLTQGSPTHHLEIEVERVR